MTEQQQRQLQVEAIAHHRARLDVRRINALKFWLPAARDHELRECEKETNRLDAIEAAARRREGGK